ncbi:MAG: glycosyltransferase family 2 protein [Bacteroidota bacterium]|nr:glycosyltransferase family 2 protein [Bacteroidota bacterium]
MADLADINPAPFISVIIPCYNEEKFLPSLLEDILRQDYPKSLTEVMIIDGGSKDRSREIISGFSEKYPYIHLLDNSKRYVPFALNEGIRKSKGEVIIRLDAHARYPENYFSCLVHYLYELKADNVGGVWNTLPGNNSLSAQAIASAVSSPFGVGNAHYRFEVKHARIVDTVPYGCYRKEVFDKIGYFDEDLLRNQDDEFNARLIKNGGVIYLVPDVKIDYYARSSVKSLMKMFCQYGLFKPLVARKLGKAVTLRQFIPPLFVLFISLFLFAGIFIRIIFYTWLAGISLYLIADLLFSAKIAGESGKWKLFFFLPWIFFLVHCSYGYGFLAGIWKFFITGSKKYKPSSTR